MSIFIQGKTIQQLIDGADSPFEALPGSRLAVALGEPDFGAALLALMRKYMDIDQIALFSLSESSGFEPVFNIGTLLAPRVAARLSHLYCMKYFRLDPLFDRIAHYGLHEGASTEVHSSATLRSDPLRQLLGFGARCSLIFEKNEQTYYLSLCRRNGSPDFSDAECSALGQLAPSLRGLIHAHRTLMHEREGGAWLRHAETHGRDCRSVEQLFFSVHHLLSQDAAKG